MPNSSFIFKKEDISGKLLSLNSPKRIVLRDPYFTTSAILFSIIPYSDKPYELILIHRSNKGMRHRGEISFPGGKFDYKYDITLLDTALRETEEEIGVPTENVEIIGCLDDFPTMTKYIITPFVGLIDQDQELVRQESEVQRILKIPIDFFVNPKNFREQAVDIEGNKFPIFYFNYQGSNGIVYNIWGATAYMIVTFLETTYELSLSRLGLKRFKLERIKQLKEYIRYRNEITKEFRQ
jgi:8-oxo-dGTP pyrophosphatase MutT (NUDIX family)